MRPISRVALILLAAATCAGAQTPSSTLEERMSQAEFRAAGLDKLSPQELAQLNSWLETHGGTRVVNRNGFATEFYPDSADREPVESHIVGVFTGWRGHTVFKLDNGQEWQQAESGRYDAGKIDSPEVRIKPMVLGSWLMRIDKCSCEVRVQRVH